jgi:hypothetical protein
MADLYPKFWRHVQLTIEERTGEEIGLAILRYCSYLFLCQIQFFLTNSSYSTRAKRTVPNPTLPAHLSPQSSLFLWRRR